MSVHIPPDQFVNIDGVRLHYLDWGGDGEPLLLLAGMGCTAHIFIELAPAFTDRFRVLALTRRGHGLSDISAEGNDIATAAHDARALLDALRLGRANLAGHSMGGAEVSAFAAHYPERVLRLVYLDGSFDWPEYPHEPPDPLAPSQPPPATFRSFDAYLAFIRAAYPQLWAVWGLAYAAMLRTTLVFYPDGSVAEKLPDEVAAAYRSSIFGFQPDYRRIRAPALGIFALGPEDLPAPDTAPDELGSLAACYWQAVILPWVRQSIERFRSELASATVLELQGANHYCFIDRRGEVVLAMRQFLLSAAGGR